LLLLQILELPTNRGRDGGLVVIFAVLVRRVGAYVPALPLERQVGWLEHAAFMDGLYDAGFFLLVGPLDGTDDVLQIVRADSADEVRGRLAGDPWMGSLLTVVRVDPWTLRLGSLG